MWEVIMGRSKAVSLWSAKKERFFHRLKLADKSKAKKAKRKSKKFNICNLLGMITHQKASFFKKRLNKRDPSTWSDALNVLGLKLAYCPSDARKIIFYIDELVAYDDLFIICYYGKKTEKRPELILGNPDKNGLVTGFKTEILFRNKLYDGTSSKGRSAARLCPNRHTKAIFRVLPIEHQRGI